MTRKEFQGKPVYAVEQYVPPAACPDLARFVIAVRVAAAAGASDVHRPRLACSLFVPEDDLCLHLLSAASPATAAEAADRAAITVERITAATVWFLT